MNFVHIAGHIGKDPETRYTSEGQEVTVFSVAVNVRKGGNDETIWFRVTMWGDRWKKMLPYLTKGKPIMVGGELSRKPEIYTDKNGLQQVSALEITADYVKFSPFGKPDQPGTEQKQAGSHLSQTYSPQQRTGSDSFQPQFGKNPFPDSEKKKNFNKHESEEQIEGVEEEESLPF
jgi:single-strand DNA-binding protein